MEQKIKDYPDIKLHREEIFIVIKTYPRPSIKYRELVCTAGITKKNKWIRLYPIDYRYVDDAKRYKKYQWISVDIEKRKEDKRIDSYKPDIKSLKVIGEPLSTKKGWYQRKKIVLNADRYESLEEIKRYYDKYKISLGMFKPKVVYDLIIEKDEGNWSKKHLLVLSQLRLFERQSKKLEKIPFKFSYIFSCYDKKCRGHRLSIIDWEIFQLYRNIKEKYQFSMDEILEKVKDRFLGDMWNKNRDSYLIVGTQYPHPTFMVLGIFWPPR